MSAITRDMIEAGEDALIDVLHGVDYAMPIDGMERVLAAALTASPSPAASPASPSGVQVKPLEWIEYPGDQFCRTFWQAKGFGGHYVVEVRHSGDFDMWLPETSSGQRFATLDEAKAAAQADYESRILSALTSDATPAATSGSEEVELEEALRQPPHVATALARHYQSKADLSPEGSSWRRRYQQAADEHRSDAALAKPASEPAGGDVAGAIAAGLKNLREHDQPGQSLDTRVARAAIAALSSSAGPAVEQYRWRSRDGSGGWSAWFDCPPPCDGDDIEIETRTLYAHPAPATVEMREDRDDG